MGRLNTAGAPGAEERRTRCRTCGRWAPALGLGDGFWTWRDRYYAPANGACPGCARRLAERVEGVRPGARRLSLAEYERLPESLRARALEPPGAGVGLLRRRRWRP